jgi:hypothetical protein
VNLPRGLARGAAINPGVFSRKRETRSLTMARVCAIVTPVSMTWSARARFSASGT